MMRPSMFADMIVIVEGIVTVVEQRYDLYSWYMLLVLSLKMYYKTRHMSRILSHLIFSIQIICVKQLSTLLIL